MRVSQDEIEENIELFVNAIYDDAESGWQDASYDAWLNAVYEEIIGYGQIHRKFIGKENLKNMIRPLLTKRLLELKQEGYNIKAI